MDKKLKAETAFIKHMITKIHPSGFVSLVSDTFDLWSVISYSLPKLKSDIMKRNGRVVIRPDSGDPVKIVCGDPLFGKTELERKGAIEALWDTFGGTITEKGYKLLDSHIGLIYGDSITLARAKEICKQLEFKGFASTNVVFGVGSFTYNYNTRDTFGFAMKATHVVINEKPMDIFKNPKTDNGVKKSAKGLVRVNSDLTLSEQVSELEASQGLLQTIFLDGFLHNQCTLQEVRNRLSNQVGV